MARNRFVGLETVRLDLSDGDYIVCKQQLDLEEAERLNAAGFETRVNDAGNVELTTNWVKFKLARLETWLVDWSFVDAAGKPVELTPAAIGTLDLATAAEIEAALDAHVAALEAGRDPTGSPARGKS